MKNDRYIIKFENQKQSAIDIFHTFFINITITQQFEQLEQSSHLIKHQY